MQSKRSGKIATIDLGTNTARLLIAKVFADGSFEQRFLKRSIVRLGGGFSHERGLAEDAMLRAMDCLHQFKQEIEHRDVVDVRAVATSAVRDAVNGADFVKRVQQETGISLAVIDGNIEAALTAKGIKAGLDQQSAQMLMFDVGGGSTEYGFTSGDRLFFSTSLPMGVVRLVSCSADPAIIADKIDQQLSFLKQQMEDENLWPDPAKTVLVGTAGTATSLAAIDLEMADYDYRLVNNHQLSRQRVAEIYHRLAPLAPAERLKVTGLEPGREDLIVAGILITLKTMDLFGFNQIKVSDYGLLEGLLFVG